MTTMYINTQVHYNIMRGGNGNPLQCSCLENSMDWGAWWATVHGVAESWTQLSYWASSTETDYFKVMSLTSSLKEIILALVLDTSYETYLGQSWISYWIFVERKNIMSNWLHKEFVHIYKFPLFPFLFFIFNHPAWGVNLQMLWEFLCICHKSVKMGEPRHRVVKKVSWSHTATTCRTWVRPWQVTLDLALFTTLLFFKSSHL